MTPHDGWYEIYVGDWRTVKCDHPADGGCMYCCRTCNYDRHFCRGCGTIVGHNQTDCGECT